ncbi:MAG: HEAT repeat domain-containing protein [Deltaproteobacteria bacterium]|nr:HEAT repeat domain-containing protein [Deltaproteobacteria bacterium]
MWRLRVVLYVLILLAAASTLVVEPAIAGAVQRGAVSARWLFLPIGVFLAFMLAFAADRAWLVRRRRYPAGRAVFQIAFGVLFAFLLLPSTLSSYRSRPMAPNGRLLQHADPEVRAAAVYALGFDAPTRDSVERVVARLDDEAPIVRRAATAVLARWSGSDDGNTAGVRTWASEFFARGDRIEGRARGQVRTSSSGGD